MIDALAYARHLESAGVDRKIAEAQAEGMVRFILPDIASKQDINHAMSELTVRLILANIGIAGLALALAKLII
jgi:hypothetical protein